MSTPTAPLAEINRLDREAFVARFGGIYEHSSWVADGAWRSRPFADRDALERALHDVVVAAGRERQLELLRAHPRLGTRRPLTDYSRAEQQGAGLMHAAPVDLGELEGLNRDYEARFGFPFILAVRNATLRQILDSCRMRVEHDAVSEFDESLRQVHRIARFRLFDMVEP